MGTTSNSVASATKTSWTIMLYIAADDALANFAVESLKQLNQSASAPADPRDEATVVVAAHFAYPDDASPLPTNAKAPRRRTIREYIFKACSESNDSTQVRTLPHAVMISSKATHSANPSETNAPVRAKTDMSEQEALTQFLNSVYQKEECKAEHYALILWGHGPELLFQPSDSPNGDSGSLYITPEQLRGALAASRLPDGSTLDIVAFDACSMSMLEMACELNGIAKYMVASQDDVPDRSFPYDNLIGLFRKMGNKPLDLLLKEGVNGYVDTYKDCICNNATGMKKVTLSVLDLNSCNTLLDNVNKLACALLQAKDKPGDDPRFAELLIQARKSSQDYAGGLYVDLHDFCTKLDEQLDHTDLEYKENIQSACAGVLAALIKGTSGSIILVNSEDKLGHAVSIYLPYLTDQQYAQVSKPLVKGGRGTSGAKGYGDILNGAASEYLMCARRNLILDTESYYGRLRFARDTKWYSFIGDRWTSALIESTPAELDYHYSAQQSWMNVTRTKADAAPGSTKTSVSPEPEMCVAK